MFFISYEELFLSHIMRDFDHKSMHKKTLKKNIFLKMISLVPIFTDVTYHN